MMRRALLAAMLACPLIAQMASTSSRRRSDPCLSTNVTRVTAQNAKPLMGRLLLDSRQGMARGGGFGQPAATPNKPEASLLLTAIQQKTALKMPPGERL